MVLRDTAGKLLVLLLMAAGGGACVEEHPVNCGGEQEGGRVLVQLEVRISENQVPKPRALQLPQEEEVSGIILFAFEKGSEENWDTTLKYVGKSIGGPQEAGATKQFTIELISGEWDLWVLANSDSIVVDFEDILGVDIYSEEFLEFDFTKSVLQAALTKSMVGKWSVDPDDAYGAYRMPMWGMIDAVQVQTSSTNIIRTVNLYRMLVKIDVEVQRLEDPDDPETYPGIPVEQFELTHVSLHNRNRIGRLIPGITAEDGSWTNAGGGGALRTSLPANPSGVYGWEPENRLEWSNPADFTTAGTALSGVIYTFEAHAGTDSDSRPCLIIGGKYDGSDEVTYYRADFLTSDKKYLSLLRNCKYKFVIRHVGGPGFSSVEDAYKAGPTHLEAEVIEWNEGGYFEGVWNGTYEIRFTGRSVHFNQFGEPSPQIIRVRSNVPTLAFENFANLTAAPTDNVWIETEPGRWWNEHFTVTIEKTATMEEYSEYEITIEAEPTEIGDPPRSSIFYATGYMLQAGIEITQNRHIEYRLLSSPDPFYAIGIDGTAQRVKIEITSTHPYKVDFMSYDMFDGVYEVAVGGTAIDPTEIEETTHELYIAVKPHTGQEARVGEFYFQHMDARSDAPALVYSVIQMTPIIIAELEEGGLSGQLPRGGGSKTIRIISNLASWYPILLINDVPYSGDLLEYFDMANGVKYQDVTFSAPALPVGSTDNRVYKIKFRDNNNATETATYITITQKALNGTPPTGGTNAPSEILAVDSNGVLNLEGRGYIVFFKWGSTIALSGSETHFSATQIAWAPDGYDISTIGDDWNKVPFADGANYPTSLPPNLPSKGLGDPCRLAVKNGETGKWKMPTTATFGEVRTDASAWTTREIQQVTEVGRLSSTVFYPAAGKRSIGTLTEVGQTGYYWSSQTSGTNAALVLNFTKNSVLTGHNGGRAVGHAIRCIPE